MVKPLSGYLERADPLAALLEHAARLRRLQSELERALPGELASCCRVGNLKNGRLSLKAEGGAAANRIRQMIPSLTAHFAQAGYPVDDIRVSVAINHSGQNETPARESDPRTLSAQASAGLEQFAAALPEDDPLRISLERLTRRSRKE